MRKRGKRYGGRAGNEGTSPTLRRQAHLGKLQDSLSNIVSSKAIVEKLLSPKTKPTNKKDLTSRDLTTWLSG